MKREDILQQFPDATDEQISAILDISGTEIKSWKDKIPKKEDYDELLRKSGEYDKLANANLTDAERVQKTLEDAEREKVEFAKKSNRLDVEKILIQADLTEDDYKDLIEGIVSDDAEKSKSLAVSLAGMITKQKEAVRQKTKEELMDGTKISGAPGAGGQEKAEDVKFAEEVSASFASGNKESADAFKNY